MRPLQIIDLKTEGPAREGLSSEVTNGLQISTHELLEHDGYEIDRYAAYAELGTLLSLHDVLLKPFRPLVVGEAARDAVLHHAIEQDGRCDVHPSQAIRLVGC